MMMQSKLNGCANCNITGSYKYIRGDAGIYIPHAAITTDYTGHVRDRMIPTVLEIPGTQS